MDERENAWIFAGFNKSKKLIERGQAQKVYLAPDADEAIASQIRALCRAAEIPVDEQFDKKALGRHCAIEVGCAVAAVKKPT